jgi:hypothetical protein
VYNDELTARTWALNSAVECHLHTVEVIGSNPIAPTINQLTLQVLPFRSYPQVSSWLISALSLLRQALLRQDHSHDAGMRHSLLFADRLGVNVHFGTHIGVPQEFLLNFHVHAKLPQCRAVGVPPHGATEPGGGAAGLVEECRMR